MLGLGESRGLQRVGLLVDVRVEEAGGGGGGGATRGSFDEGLLFCPPAACCMRQWILNQLDRRPYLEPDLDIPTMRHFRNRQALQAVRFFLLMTHR